MNDLISRKAVEKAIRAYADEVGCNRGEYELANGILKSLSIVVNQPTAYDVDKVINKLENKMFSAELYGDEWDGQTVNNLLCMGDVYEIVKGGGKDE